MGYRLFLFVLWFSPFFVQASDNSCLDQIRKSLVQNPSRLPLEMRQALDFYAGPQSLVRNEETFSRDYDEDSKTKALNYEYESPVSKSRTVEVTYNITPVTGWGRQSIFEVMQSVILKDSSGVKIFEDETTFGFNQNCQPEKVRHKTNSYLYQGDGLTLTTRDAGSGLTPKVFRFRLDANGAGQLKAVDALDKVHSILALVGKTIQYPDVDEDEIILRQFQIVRSIKTERFNPLTQKIELMDGVEYAMGPVKGEFHASQDEKFRYTVTEINGTKSFAEGVQKQKWFNLVLDRDSSKTVQMIGFQEKDFSAPILSYKIEGSKIKAPPLHNQTMYFKEVERSEDVQSNQWSITVTSYLPNVPAVLRWDTPSADEDKKYLSFSKYIQAEPVSSFVKALRPKLRGLDRLEAAHVILQTVTQALSYDENAVGKNLVDIRSVEEVLKEKKGVCQHYAALFVSIARSLGIPSRIVSGYFINQNDAVHHAWVEIKLNTSDWWPLEPQVVSKSLPTRRYIPMGELTVYERPVGSSAEDLLIQYLNYANVGKPWESTKMTKLH